MDIHFLMHFHPLCVSCFGLLLTGFPRRVFVPRYLFLVKLLAFLSLLVLCYVLCVFNGWLSIWYTCCRYPIIDAECVRLSIRLSVLLYSLPFCFNLCHSSTFLTIIFTGVLLCSAFWCHLCSAFWCPQGLPACSWIAISVSSYRHIWSMLYHLWVVSY